MGDPACWLNQLCPECSAMLEPPTHDVDTIQCWRCDATLRFGEHGPEVVQTP
jgi:DNA-directed RNA polymerase subunit M/transcription elongation factor TFIIS